MLKTRIIPTLLWKDFGLVKGVSFDSWRRVGTVMPAIKVYNTRDVDELILLDISATGEQLAPDYEEVSFFAAECFVPLTVGGGVNSLDTIDNLLRAGADRVSINTAAYKNPELIYTSAKRFGTQCIVVSVDVKWIEGRYQCFSHSGTHPEAIELGAWVKRLEELGAGELLITSIDRDGTMIGYEVDLIRYVTERVNIPVIASGGAGSYHHMYEAIEIGNASAVAAASIFQFTEKTPLEAKVYLSDHRVPVRLDR